MALRGAINRGRGFGCHRESCGVTGSGQQRAQLIEITKTKCLKHLNSIFLVGSATAVFRIAYDMPCAVAASSGPYP